MMAYQTVSVSVGSVDEHNMKVSQVGGEGKVGSSIQPMWRRREGEECLLPHSTPDSSSPYEGSQLDMGGMEQPKEKEEGDGKERTIILLVKERRCKKEN